MACIRGPLCQYCVFKTDCERGREHARGFSPRCDGNPLCQSCRYMARITGGTRCCDYRWITGKTKHRAREETGKRDKPGDCLFWEAKVRYTGPKPVLSAAPKTVEKKQKTPAAKKPQNKTKVDRVRLRVLYDAGLNDHEIAARIGCDSSTVYLWRKSAHLTPNGVSPKVDHTNTRALYDAGLNDRQIAEKLGCSASAARKWRNREGLPSQREKKRRSPRTTTDAKSGETKKE